jgi:hypothetical protein
MTRRIALDRPPDGDRVDGVVINDWRPPPEQGEIVLVEVYGKRWRRLARVVELCLEERRYSVELIR